MTRHPYTAIAMRYDPEHTRTHYDQLAEGEAARWKKSRLMQLQHEVFGWHLTQRVAAGQRVLDAGCGAGVYTRQLIALGARVTALDISPVQLGLCREHAPGAADYVEGTIVDLSRFDTGSFDVVLAYGGALSYCFDEVETALAQLVRVLRPGGTFGASVMSLFGAMHNFLPGVIADLDTTREVLASGNLTRASNRGHECHLFRLDELKALLDGAGLHDAELRAPAWISAVWTDDQLPEPGSEAWRMLVDAEIQAGLENPTAGTHIIVWGTR